MASPKNLREHESYRVLVAYYNHIWSGMKKKSRRAVVKTTHTENGYTDSCECNADQKADLTKSIHESETVVWEVNVFGYLTRHVMIF